MATISDVGVDISKIGFPVIVLLRHDAVEPDHAPARMRNCFLPDAQAVTAATQIGPHDVETEEGKAVAVIDARDGCGRFAIELCDEKSARVDRSETGGVIEAWIPAFGRGPVDCDPDFIRPHGADDEAVGGIWRHEINRFSAVRREPIRNSID